MEGMASIYKYGSAFRDEVCNILDKLMRGARTRKDLEIAEQLKSMFLESSIGIPHPNSRTPISDKHKEREGTVEPLFGEEELVELLKENKKELKDTQRKIKELGRKINKYPKDSIAFTFTDPWDLVYADPVLLKLQDEQSSCSRYADHLKRLIIPSIESNLKEVRERQAKKQAESELQAREQCIKLTPFGPIRPEIKLTPFGPVKPITPPPVETETPVTEPCIKLTPFGPIKPVIPPPVEKAEIPPPVEIETPSAKELEITLTPFGLVKPIIPPTEVKPVTSSPGETETPSPPIKTKTPSPVDNETTLSPPPF